MFTSTDLSHSCFGIILYQLFQFISQFVCRINFTHCKSACSKLYVSSNVQHIITCATDFITESSTVKCKCTHSNEIIFRWYSVYSARLLISLTISCKFNGKIITVHLLIDEHRVFSNQTIKSIFSSLKSESVMWNSLKPRYTPLKCARGQGYELRVPSILHGFWVTLFCPAAQQQIHWHKDQNRKTRDIRDNQWMKLIV